MTSYKRDADAEAQPPTPRERALMDHDLPITPIDQPVLAFPKPAKLDARSYMQPHRVPGSRQVAEWNKEMFLGFGDGSKDYLVSEPLQWREGPSVAEPIRPGAPTIITTFTWEPDDSNGQSQSSRPLDEYLGRFQKLADTGEMVIFYTNERMRETIAAMRPNDPHWHVITPWESVWDVPNNLHQHENFKRTQPDLFARFQDTGPVPRYNVDRLSAAFNSKAYCIFDGVQRAPFGGRGPFMFYDSGWIVVDQQDPGFEEVAAEFIDDAKVARSAAFAGDTGVVVGEYELKQEAEDPEDPTRPGPPVDVNHRAFLRPEKSWEALHFLGGSVVGSPLGMLNYAARFMQSVEDMGANGFYVGREELVMSFLAVRYPNTIFSVPAGDAPGMANPWPIRDCHSGRWGPDDVAALVDPVQTLFCRFYEPRRPNLPAVAGKKRREYMEKQQQQQQSESSETPGK
ncbi:hypothetical protein PG985_014584 [Apiospora marii]|uniref:Uncharacterized protein n=1 Tax=Apiospora marii TaxID=335849 RepID=A0ABR1R4L2_9PEZI